MIKNLDFVLRSLIIYITLGFAICATTQLFSKYTHYPQLIAYIGFYMIMGRLFRYDKGKAIKFFKYSVAKFLNYRHYNLLYGLIQFDLITNFSKARNNGKLLCNKFSMLYYFL